MRAAAAALLAIAGVFAQSVYAQTAPDQTPRIDYHAPGSWTTRFFVPYFAPRVAPPNLDNTPRIYSLIRAGSLYLSLSDAIALAIENNLDIERERYAAASSPATHTLRASGGGTLRGIAHHAGSLRHRRPVVPTAEYLRDRLSCDG